MSITNLTSINTFHSGSYIDGETRITSAKSVSNVNVSQVTGDNRQDALEKLNNLLTQAYDKLSFRSVSAIEKYQENTPLTAEKVANNVLGFIQRRLQQDQAEGATAEQLQSRLDAGLAGFKKGFAEATEQLKALSLFSPEVEQDLAKTNELVLAGIDSLQTRLTNGESLGAPTNSSSISKLNMNGVPVGVALAAQQTQAYKFTDIDYSKAEARDFKFDVTTKEGDKVIIRASASYGANVSRQGNTLSGSYSESQSFSFEVQGDLNEEELTSINLLLGKVNDLAEDFYAGDYETAFANALEFDFADQQIADFSLNLSQASIEVVTQVETSPVVVADEAIENQSVEISHKNNTKTMGDFIEALFKALDDARAFNNPEKLLLDIAKGISLLKEEEYKALPNNTIEHPKNFDDFLARLIKANAAREQQSV